MSPLRAALSLARGKRDGDDTGFSLIETMVAMSLFGIFSALVMAAIIAMLTSTQKSQSLNDGAQQLENTFQKLDHQVHYASSINTPGTVGANWYVEWQTPATSTSVQQCTQLKYDATARTLLERSWSPTVLPVTASPWHLLAAHLVNNLTQTTQVPFTETGTSPDAYGIAHAHETLQVHVYTRTGGQSTAGAGTALAKTAVSETNVTFTALNSNSKNSSTVCQEVARS